MDLPISALPAATLPLAGSEAFALVQGGTTKQASVSALAGSVSYTSSAQSATSDSVLSFTLPGPLNGLFEVDVVISITSLITPDTMTILGGVLDVDGANPIEFDGPATQSSVASDLTSFCASTTSTPVIPASGDQITINYRFHGTSFTAASLLVSVGPLFVGTFDVVCVITQKAAFSF